MRREDQARQASNQLRALARGPGRKGGGVGRVWMWGGCKCKVGARVWNGCVGVGVGLHSSDKKKRDNTACCESTPSSTAWNKEIYHKPRWPKAGTNALSPHRSHLPLGPPLSTATGTKANKTKCCESTPLSTATGTNVKHSQPLTAAITHLARLRAPLLEQ